MNGKVFHITLKSVMANDVVHRISTILVRCDVGLESFEISVTSGLYECEFDT